MKNVWKQLGKSVCYFFLFLGMQIIVSFVGMFAIGFMLGVQASMGGSVDQQLLAAQLEEATLRNAVTLTMVADLLSVVFLMIFFKIRKKKWTQEANLNRIPAKSIPLLVVAAVGLACCSNGVLNLLPASLLESYMEASGGLFEEYTILSLIAEVIAIPFAEEIFFRGMILSRLKKAMPLPVAIILSSFAFGLIHGQILWIIYTFLVGCVFALVAEKTGSVTSSVIMHMIFNLFGFVLSLWEGDSSVPIFAVMTLIGIVVLAVSGYLIFKKDVTQDRVTA